MTQHGSFPPDRPRGRRARHGSEPEWEGDREFPDLEPIRDQRLSAADNRGLPGGPGGDAPGGSASSGSAPGSRGRHSGGGGQDGAFWDAAPGGGDGTGPWRTQQPASPYDQRQAGPAGGPAGQSARQQSSGQPLGGRQGGAERQLGGPSFGGQQGYDQRQPGGPSLSGQQGLDRQGFDRQRPDQQGFDQPGFDQQGRFGGPTGAGPGQQYGDQSFSEELAGRSRGGQRGPGQYGPDGQSLGVEEQPRGGRRASRGQVVDDEITDDPMEAFSKRWERRGAETPKERRRRRLIYGGGAGVVVIALAVIGYFLFGGGTGTGTGPNFGSLVTTFLPGEIQKVPDACTAVSSSTLSTYLPGSQSPPAAPPLNGGLDSQCTWSLDSAPTYRVIEDDINAFSPSGLASGDGSATFAALDAYASDQQVLQSPSAKSGQPAATITDIPGLGDKAFSATQIFNVNGATTYKVTVIVRYHNVIVTVIVNGLEHAKTAKGTYGPVDMSTLTAAAQQVATEAITAVKR